MAANELAIYVLSTVIGMLLLCVALLIWSIGRLTNKLMSRNFYDYEVTRNLAATEKNATMNKNSLEVHDDQSIEDLGYLN